MNDPNYQNAYALGPEMRQPGGAVHLPIQNRMVNHPRIKHLKKSNILPYSKA